MDHERKIHDTLFISSKIITYKAAAAILNVSVNEAKTVLKKYVKDKKDESLNVSYVIGGITKDSAHKITIVPAEKYEKIKKTFKNITIDHIYSIQKSLLQDWIHVFNVDDLLYDKEEKQKEERVEIKEEPVKTSPAKKEPTSPAKNKKATNNKKPGISNFFTQAQKSTNKTVKKEPVEKPSKPNALSSFISKNKTSNKENTPKSINKLSPKKEDVSMEVDSEDEDIVKTKKRTRAIADDEEEENTPSKCPKVDILDDDTDEDIFEPSDKEEEEEEIKEPEVKEETKESETKTDEPEGDVMYQDEDGYFVVERKLSGRKSTRKSPEKKKDPVVEKAEKKSKKEIIQKIKKNTNQNTLLSYFQKK